jgi:ubiquinone/menaquinone biosynthesis C-methylase UbiE
MPIRNLFMPPERMLAEVEIEPGSHILDFGCGPGAFTILTAEKTGPSGLVHALDIHPLAASTVEKRAAKKNLTNIRTILSDGPTSLDDHSTDLIIFFDVFHNLDNPDDVLKELHRVLKPDGTLCFSDHHMKEGDILSRLDDKGLFKLKRKGKMTFTFSKV